MVWYGMVWWYGRTTTTALSATTKEENIIIKMMSFRGCQAVAQDVRPSTGNVRPRVNASSLVWWYGTIPYQYHTPYQLGRYYDLVVRRDQ